MTIDEPAPSRAKNRWRQMLLACVCLTVMVAAPPALRGSPRDAAVPLDHRGIAFDQTAFGVSANRPSTVENSAPPAFFAPDRPINHPSQRENPANLLPVAGAPAPDASKAPSLFGGTLPDLSNRQTFSSAMQIIVLMTVLSLAPALLIMMTSFTRIIIVLTLLRQALGTQQLPPNQVLTGLALFMTFFIMGPTWTRINNQAIKPYLDGRLDQNTALTKAQQPIRDFMEQQILRSHDTQDVYLFANFAHEHPKSFADVGTMTMIPAFMLSELKTAFFMGFKIYLPFLIIDMVISAVLVSMGMMMLPPVLISLPFKLLLFVLVDGWHLITGSLLGSFIT